MSDNRLCFESELLKQPLITANPELARINDQTVVDYLARFDHASIAMQVRSKIIEQLPDGFFDEHVKPTIALGRLIEPAEIASAVALLIENPAISGQLWIDAGLRPMA